MNTFTSKFLVVLFFALGATAQAADIRVVSSGGFAAAYKALAPEFEKQTGNKLISEWGPSMGNTKNAIPLRLERGEDIDIVIMVGKSLDELMAQGKLVLGSKVVLANSPIACAVKQGAKKPDISTVEKFKKTLLDVKSIAYSDSASGEYIKNELMDKLGIKSQVQGKARQIPETPVGEIIAKGEAEFGCQQRSELKPIKGIEIIGLIPSEVQLISEFSAAIVASSVRQNEARSLLTFISSPKNAHIIEDTGLQPVSK